MYPHEHPLRMEYCDEHQSPQTFLVKTNVSFLQQPLEHDDLMTDRGNLQYYFEVQFNFRNEW